MSHCCHGKGPARCAVCGPPDNSGEKQAALVFSSLLTTRWPRLFSSEIREKHGIWGGFWVCSNQPGCVLVPEKAVSNSLCSSWLLRTDMAITGRTGLLRAPTTIVFFSLPLLLLVQRKLFFTSPRSRTA